jgi:hypothetical protein
MNICKQFLFTIIVIVCGCSHLQAQQERAFLVMCDAVPSQLIVINSNGEWIPHVKSVIINININGVTELIAKSYKGVIEPSNPETKTYELAQIKSISQQQFTAIIDGLQQDTSYVRNSGTFRRSTPSQNDEQNEGVDNLQLSRDDLNN